MCAAQKRSREEEEDVANPQIATEALVERLRKAVDDDVLRRRGGNPVELSAFLQALETVEDDETLGDLDDVARFAELGIATFACSPSPQLYDDLTVVDLSANDGRRFQRYAENRTTWDRLPAELQAWLTHFVLDYFGLFAQNRGERIVGVSNLLIRPQRRAQRRAQQPPLIQKLHLDHMYGAGNEMVVAIDLSGAPLGTRYFARSHDVPGFNEGFNLRCNKGDGDLGTFREAGVACNATRLADLLARATARGVAIRHVEAARNGMVFDAGGLHGGNAVRSDGPRVFWTFRTQSFHDRYTRDIREVGEARLMFQDTWFPMQERERIALGVVPWPDQ